MRHIVLLALLVTGCDLDEGDKEMTLECPDHTDGALYTTVGADMRVWALDACGQENVPACPSEGVTDVLSATVDDPAIFSVSTAGFFEGELILHALAPGSTVLRVSAVFDDGTTRNATAWVRADP